MGINFRDVFKEQSTQVLSEPIIKSLTAELQSRTNTSLKYISGLNGEAILIDPNGSLSFNVKLDLPKEIKELKINNSEDLLTYLYNTQTSLNINSDLIKINGIQFKLSDIIHFPFVENETEAFNSMIIPEPFASPHSIRIRFGESEVEFLVQQVVHPSVEEIKFKSNNIPALVLTLIYNTVTKRLNLKIDFDAQKANSVSKVIYYIEIMNNFYENNIFLENEPFKLNNSIKKNGTQITNSTFWKKLKEIESYFSVTFDNKINFDGSDVIEVEKLYLSFIEKKAFKTNNQKRVNQLFLDLDIPKEELLKIDENIEKERYLRLCTHNLLTITMLGAKFDVKNLILNQGIKFIDYQHTTENIIVDTQYSDNGFDSELYVDADIDIDEDALATHTPILEKPIELKKSLDDSYGKSSSK
ncbi:abortive infection system toxin AbiGii family protein [Carnobacterium maltaromaticum]|uniref:abortive infection system toxin AbiGii family protein n=1 Tax=Carnobacterium maltaromaticum TaxID=2751 RepID=UPI0039B11F6F